MIPEHIDDYKRSLGPDPAIIEAELEVQRKHKALTSNAYQLLAAAKRVLAACDAVPEDANEFNIALEELEDSINTCEGN